MAIAYKHLSDRVPAPSATVPDLPSDLDAFVASATDPVRELRPESASAMRRDLATIASALGKARTLASLVDEAPRVVPEPLAEGTAALDGGAITETIPQARSGTIDRPRRGWRKVVLAALATLVLATTAWAVWTYVVPHSSPVPDVVGQPVDTAADQLSDLGFQVVIADGEYSSSIPAGSVKRLSPRDGTVLDEGAPVTLVPSLGPPPVNVPDVTGLTEARARARLSDAGLAIGSVKHVYDDRIPEGEIVKQSPADGTAPEGSGVDLWVSKGHAPVPVPAVIGKPQVKAERILRDAGFTPVVQFAFSDDIARGDVISVEPAEASEAIYGSAVTITVSQGPEEFPVPDFVGLSPVAAKALARDHGLYVTLNFVPGTSQTSVISQVPGAGATVRAGDTIDLWIA
jgi:serine/threonine-protein kinase